MTNIANDTEKPSLGGSGLNDGLAVTKLIAGSEAHMTLLMSKFNLHFCLCQDRKDLLEFATLLWYEATKAEREACAKVCELTVDTGDREGVERDVQVWNLATRYCLYNIKMRHNE